MAVMSGGHGPRFYRDSFDPNTTSGVPFPTGLTICLGLRPQTDKKRDSVASRVFLASLRLCVRLFFQPIDDTRNAVLDERRVEVDQQAKPLVGQPQIGQKLLFVNRREGLDRLDLDD